MAFYPSQPVLPTFLQRFSNRLDTVMIYTDAVQSTVVNQGKFPLLRSLQLNRRGQGRVTVDPLEWNDVRDARISISYS